MMIFIVEQNLTGISNVIVFQKVESNWWMG